MNYSPMRKLPKAIATSFLDLIPKTHNHRTLSEFRPIFLVGSVYRIMAKMLAGRLNKVISVLISCSQYASIPNRQMLYGMVVLNDVVDYARRYKK